MRNRIRLLTQAAVIAACTSAYAEGQLNIYTWTDSIDPALIDKFAEEYDVEVTIDGYVSNEDLLTKLQAGSSGYDVVMPSQHFVRIMTDEGLLENIGAKSLEAYERVDEKWRGQWWDENNDYSIPFAFGTAGYAVNRDVYDGPVDSWKYFFEPEGALKNNVAELSYPDEVVGAAQNYLGVEYCTEDPEEMKKVLDLLMAQKPDVVAYTSDNIGNRIGSGEVGAHFWWDGEAMKTRSEGGANIEFSMPKEGLVGWLDSMVVPKGASNIDNAKLFINFVSMPENATAQYNYYGHSSPFALDLDKAKYTPENAPELFPTVPVYFSKACSPAAQDLVTKVWDQLLQ